MIPITTSNDLTNSIDGVKYCTNDLIHLRRERSQSSFVTGSQQCQASVTRSGSTCSPSSKTKESHGVEVKTSAFDGNNDGQTESHSSSDEVLQDSTDTSDTFRSISHQRRSSSTDTVKRVTARPDKVHFAASPYLQKISKASEDHTPSFRNPFSGEEEAQSRRTSDTSQISDIFLPERFAGHRDTLALLLDDVDDADEDEEQDSFNNTPTQAGYLYHRRRTPLR